MSAECLLKVYIIRAKKLAVKNKKCFWDWFPNGLDFVETTYNYYTKEL